MNIDNKNPLYTGTDLAPKYLIAKATRRNLEE